MRTFVAFFAVSWFAMVRLAGAQATPMPAPDSNDHLMLPSADRALYSHDDPAAAADRYHQRMSDVFHVPPSTTPNRGLTCENGLSVDRMDPTSAAGSGLMAGAGTVAAVDGADPRFDGDVPGSGPDQTSFTLSLDQPLYLADSSTAPSSTYRGGRGLITLQGMSGMFMNPTSGTLNQGQFTAQYCLLVNRFDLNSVVGHGLMLDYGVRDWLEVGLFGTIAEINGVDRRWFDDPIGVAGPFARVRLLKDEGLIPEVSIGGIYLDGGTTGKVLRRTEGFIAASKGVPLDPDGFARSLRFHLGVRYVDRSQANVGLPAGTLGAGDFCLLYGGLELELPYSLYLIGEVSSNNLLKEGGKELPFAGGIQWRPNSVLGISLAYQDPVFLNLHRALWFGVGLNFQF